jgi:hypothetical protein
LSETTARAATGYWLYAGGGASVSWEFDRPLGRGGARAAGIGSEGCVEVGVAVVGLAGTTVDVEVTD